MYSQPCGPTPSTTARAPFGVYPQLITHDCAQLSGVDILCHTLSLKTLVRDSESELGADARQCAEIRDARRMPQGRMRVTFAIRIEVEGSAKPALLAHVNYVYMP